MNKIESETFLGQPESLISKSIKKLRLPEPAYVAKPSMPRLRDFVEIMKKIWQSKWLTNNGAYHQALEQKLCVYLGAEYCSLFANGTLALLIGLKALKLSGEVITTPFTFPATVNTLQWLNLTPVFADIEEETFNIDPARIEALITEKTTAILPVHIFGTPCRVDEIQRLADRHELKVVYDAAHCMGTRLRGRAVAHYGDFSILSFHATKLFSTLEGGALITTSEKLKKEVDLLKNFGIADEETVLAPGINAKLNEFQAAFGLLHLKMLEKEISERRQIATLYRERIKRIPGLAAQGDFPGIEPNHGYFPVLVEEEEFGLSRDLLYLYLKRFNVYTRKYFYPLISRFSFFKDLPSAAPERLPVAEKIAKKILCLPIFGNLPLKSVETICEILAFVHEHHEEFAQFA